MTAIPLYSTEYSVHGAEMTWTDYATEEEAQILAEMRNRHKFFIVQRRLIYDRCRKRMRKDKASLPTEAR